MKNLGLSPEWRLTLPNPKNKEDLHKQADNAADEHHDLRGGNLSLSSRDKCEYTHEQTLDDLVQEQWVRVFRDQIRITRMRY